MIKRKIAALLLVGLFSSFAVLIASESTMYVDFFVKYGEYLKAAKSQDPNAINILKQALAIGEKYIKKYEDKKDINTIETLKKLVDGFYKLKNYDKVIFYGEKLITKAKINDMDKMGVYIVLSEVYALTKRDIKRAESFADNAITLGKAKYESSKSPAEKNKWKILLSKAYLLYGNALLINKEYEKALDAYMESFKLVPTTHGLKRLRSMGLFFLTKGNNYEAGLKALEFVIQVFKKQNIRGKSYKTCLKRLCVVTFKHKDYSKSLKYYKELYALEKNSKYALNIGIIYNKLGDKENAKRYFAEAVVLNGTKYGESAKKILETLCSVDQGGKKILDEEEYNKYIEEAKRRLGK